MVNHMSLPPQFTAMAISHPGGPDVLTPADLPLVAPGPGDVLIRVAAAGVNAPDLAQRRGIYPPPVGASPLPGLEVAGDVVAIGPGVTRLAEGDAVMALTNGGGYAEFVTVPESQALLMPQGLSYAEAASLPETAFTITQALVMRAGLMPGMNVLIHGAAGGIGGMAILMSRLFGARPLAVVSTTEKADYARHLGAEAVIRHDAEDFVARALELTNGQGADRIVDIVGGDTLNRNIHAAARFGHIVLLSTPGGGTAPIEASRLMMKQLTLSGSTLRPQSPEIKARIAEVVADTLLPAIAARHVNLPRLTLFALRHAAEAHRTLEDRAHYGKIVLLTPYGQSVSRPPVIGRTMAVE
jgi:NADPH2:quinone reductase